MTTEDDEEAYYPASSTKDDVEDQYSSNDNIGKAKSDEETKERKVDSELIHLILPLRLQHKLAHAKFETLGALTHSGPIIVLSLISGILSFFSSTLDSNDSQEPEDCIKANDTNVVVNGLNYTLDTESDDENFEFISAKTREAFIITVGVLSLVQVAIQQIGQSLNFGARSQMHHLVEMNLEEIYDKMVFQERTAEGGQLRAYQLETFQALYDQCLASCSSPMPIEIAQAFKLVEDRCMAFQIKKLYERRKNKGGAPNSVEIRKHFVAFAFNELYAEITSHYLWKVFPRCPKKAADRVMNRLEEEWRYMYQGWSKESRRVCLCCCYYTALVKPKDYPTAIEEPASEQNLWLSTSKRDHSYEVMQT